MKYYIVKKSNGEYLSNANDPTDPQQAYVFSTNHEVADINYRHTVEEGEVHHEVLFALDTDESNVPYLRKIIDPNPVEKK